MQRRHEQRDEDDEGAQEVELDLEPGKYVRGCLLCYIFAEANGVALLKRLRVVARCAALVSPWKQGATKGRCLILEKSASFHAARLSPPPPPPIIIPSG